MTEHERDPLDYEGLWHTADYNHHHVAPKPETIEDVCAEAPQDQVSLDLVNRAYECGKRDGRKLDAAECRACAAAVMGR